MLDVQMIILYFRNQCTPFYEHRGRYCSISRLEQAVRLGSSHCGNHDHHEDFDIGQNTEFEGEKCKNGEKEK